MTVGLRVWLVVSVGSAALYLSTMAPGLLWGDSGDAQLRVLLQEWHDDSIPSRSHPLYYVLTIGVSQLGLTPAVAATSVSALAGGVTVGNLALLLLGLVGRKWAAVLCGVILLAVSHAMWHISTVAEVMSFSTMLMSIELLLVMRFCRTGESRWFVDALLVNGLHLSAHNLAMLMWPAYLVLVVGRVFAGRAVSLRTVALGLGALLVGALPIVAVFVVQGRVDGDWGRVFLDMLVGKYEANVFNTGDLVGLAGRMVAYTAYCFPSPVILLSVIGVASLWRRRDEGATGFLLTAFVTYAFFAIRYNVPDQHVFMLHSYLLLCVLVGVGVDRVYNLKRLPVRPAVLVGLTLMGPVVYGVVPELLRTRFPDIALTPARHVPFRDRYNWFLKPWRCGDDGAERFARKSLGELPEGSVLMVDSTLHPPLLYLQHTENLRRDIRILGAHAYQPWFAEKIDMGSEQRDLLISEGRVFTYTRDRKYWNNHFRNARYDAVPFGDALQVVFAAE